jgi:hypothetical protein
LKAGTVGAASVMAGGVASVLFRLSKELF